MKKISLLFVMVLVTFSSVLAQSPQNGDLVIMTEKVVVPSGELGGQHKAPAAPLYMYQTGGSLYFGEAFAGCQVTLWNDDELVYSTAVDSNGQAEIPASFTGTFELQITIGSTVYSAYIDL